MLNITRDTGELLALLVQTRGRRMCWRLVPPTAIPTLWLAEAVKRLEGRVTTIERDAGKLAMATANFQRAGLGPGLNSWRGGLAACCLPCRRRVISWSSWTPIASNISAGGLRSGACSPRAACWWWTTPSLTGEMQEWMAEVAQDPAFMTALVPVGRGVAGGAPVAPWLLPRGTSTIPWCSFTSWEPQSHQWLPWAAVLSFLIFRPLVLLPGLLPYRQRWQCRPLLALSTISLNIPVFHGWEETSRDMFCPCR